MSGIVMSRRFQNILEVLKDQKIEALLLNSEANVSYAAGFRAPDSYGIATAHGLTLITDFRYTADFTRLAPAHVNVIATHKTFFKTICGLLKKESIKKVGFESRSLSFAECQTLLDLSKKKITWIPLKETLERLRVLKDEEELGYIRKAVRITLKAYAFIEKKIKEGVTELSLAAEIERFIRLQGATSSAFDTIVASGPNSSYPHARISDRTLKKGDTIVMDMGVTVDGYKSDLTRTFFLGRINPVVRRVDAIVRCAQERALRAVKPGASIKSIDLAARNYIEEKGFGKNFGHACGHGVGLEVHEAPFLNKKNNSPLEKGMVFTVEPGIYLPGDFGIRMEEMALVTRDGVEVLSGIVRY
jgi:Xaa-Pro aminopeptidase